MAKTKSLAAEFETILRQPEPEQVAAFLDIRARRDLAVANLERRDDFQEALALASDSGPVIEDEADAIDLMYPLPPYARLVVDADTFATDDAATEDEEPGEDDEDEYEDAPPLRAYVRKSAQNRLDDAAFFLEDPQDCGLSRRTLNVFNRAAEQDDMAQNLAVHIYATSKDGLALVEAGRELDRLAWRISGQDPESLGFLHDNLHLATYGGGITANVMDERVFLGQSQDLLYKYKCPTMGVVEHDYLVYLHGCGLLRSSSEDTSTSNLTPRGEALLAYLDRAYGKSEAEYEQFWTTKAGKADCAYLHDVLFPAKGLAN